MKGDDGGAAAAEQKTMRCDRRQGKKGDNGEGLEEGRDGEEEEKWERFLASEQEDEAAAKAMV